MACGLQTISSTEQSAMGRESRFNPVPRGKPQLSMFKVEPGKETLMLASSGGDSVIQNDKGNSDGMSQDDQIKSKLLPHIQNAYALENQIVKTLEGHVKETADYPDVQQIVQQHLEQTKQHRDRMEQCLKTYGDNPSAIKGLGSNLMGNMMGAMAGMRPDTISRIARDEYVTEHLEIAAYTLLITTAQAFGDQATIQAATMNLRDEIAMQQWLLQHMPEVCMRELANEGIDVSGISQGSQAMYTDMGTQSSMTAGGE
jgi:ferritin-like metal-binding protein YciE